MNTQVLHRCGCENGLSVENRLSRRSEPPSIPIAYSPPSTSRDLECGRPGHRENWESTDPIFLCILFSHTLCSLFHHLILPHSPDLLPRLLHAQLLSLLSFVYCRKGRQDLRILAISQIVSLIPLLPHLNRFTHPLGTTSTSSAAAFEPGAVAGTPNTRLVSSTTATHQSLAMPPQRTIPPAKAVKTERTHEENQERLASQSFIQSEKCN